MTFDPRFLEFSRWAALVSQSLLGFGFVPQRAEEEDWQRWASAVVNLPAIAATNVPRPEGFQNWQAWGYRLNEALLNLGL